MKKLFFVIIFLAILAACSSAAENVHKFFDFSINIDNGSEIKNADPSGIGYKLGIRYGIASMSSEEYVSSDDAQRENYYAFSIYQPKVIQTTDIKSITDSVCSDVRTKIVNAFHSQSFDLYQLKQYCNPLTEYIVIHNWKLYKFETTDDTENFEGVWNLLKEIHFDK